MKSVPFNLPTLVGTEFEAIADAISNRHLSGNGNFTQQCQSWLESHLRGGKALLTHSCTAALEMSALLAQLQPGDEVILPSFTFSSTANAFVLRGAVPVFVDIRPDTLNIDETLIEAAINPRTKAVCVVHYAGVAAAMNPIMKVAAKHGLLVIEDAAQALFASYEGQPLGTIGHMAAFSFHETKNIMSGEGGAFIVNDTRFTERAEIIWEKGTDRAKFQRGEIAKYSWIDVGSSFLPSDLVAAFLLCQLQAGQDITRRRVALWNRYYEAFTAIEADGLARRPIVPPGCIHNGHIFYLLAPNGAARERALAVAKQQAVNAIMHYVPLHSAPAGRRFGRVGSGMAVTDDIASRLIRVPLHLQLTDADQDYAVATLHQALAFA